MQETEDKLKKTVRDLLDGEKVDVVIGYEAGSLPLRSRPCFIRNADASEKIVWNAFCTNNLAIYLPRLFQREAHVKPQDFTPPRVGVVAKGCDVRSVMGLLTEHQIPRENVLIIGVPCPGMVDPARVEAALNGDCVSDCKEGPDGTLDVTTNRGEKKQLKREDIIAEACLDCSHPSPEGADVLIEGEAKAVVGEKYQDVKEFEAKTPDERWQYFVDEMSRCIRCNACRQACPNCYCTVCFADQSKPRWIGPGDDPSDVMLYHIGRIFHQAGRCVACGACVRACPMNIDLRTFTQKLVKDIEELFDHEPGMSAEEPPPLCVFKADDSESFITEPQED